MGGLKPLITFEQARKKAEESARRAQAYFMTDADMPALREEHLEAENCWMFFRNKDIKLPDPSTIDGLLPDGAYCISKRGEGRIVPDFSDRPKECRDYLERISDYFKEKGL
jgi:hypothetical protein